MQENPEGTWAKWRVVPCTSMGHKERSAGVGQNTIAGPTHWVPEVTTIRESVRA